MKITGKSSLSSFLNFLASISLVCIAILLAISVISLFIDLQFVSNASLTIETFKFPLDREITKSAQFIIPLVLLFLTTIFIIINFKKILKELIENNLFSEKILGALLNISYSLVPLSFIKSFLFFSATVKLMAMNPELDSIMSTYYQLFDQGILLSAAAVFLTAHIYKEAIRQYEENKFTI